MNFPVGDIWTYTLSHIFKCVFLLLLHSTVVKAHLSLLISVFPEEQTSEASVSEAVSVDKAWHTFFNCPLRPPGPFRVKCTRHVLKVENVCVVFSVCTSISWPEECSLLCWLWGMLQITVTAARRSLGGSQVWKESDQSGIKTHFIYTLLLFISPSV